MDIIEVRTKEEIDGIWNVGAVEDMWSSPDETKEECQLNKGTGNWERYCRSHATDLVTLIGHVYVTHMAPARLPNILLHSDSEEDQRRSG